MTNATAVSKGYFAKLAGTLLLISAVVAGLLGLVDHITADKIAAINQEKTGRLHGAGASCQRIQ